ncbi:hypothetical protein EYR36_000177 [Pleurotus pulmonarius]|nr:hypothetical protein EYR36_000177 [Pleurotus pulmonarius]
MYNNQYADAHTSEQQYSAPAYSQTRPNGLQAAQQAFPGLFPGGRSAPINPNAQLPAHMRRALPPVIAMEDHKSRVLSVGDFVRVARFSRSKKTFYPSRIGQIKNVGTDTVHCTRTFDVLHVDAYTRKCEEETYEIWRGDSIVPLDGGNTQELAALYANASNATAPTMGPAHSNASKALATPHVRGEIHSPSRRR